MIVSRKILLGIKNVKKVDGWLTVHPSITLV